MYCLLPTDCPPQLKARLERAGVHFGDLIRNGEVRHGSIPEGWKFRSTGKGNDEELVDGDGEVQALIFHVSADYPCLREYNGKG